LTKEYDIRVYGPGGIELNPDQDLNGASRRAITLAFILALTKISEVEAPNIIDTPLGMMSGYVKQSVLRQTLKEGSQIILFLTHDEIKGVENILDEFAGKIFTLTNPAHYPKMLKNPQNVSDTRVLRCECTHRQICSICERKDAGV
jgi:DNA sulfur modification protein DndD